ncbi:unnamed protein product, partial [Durusdinium trenchii]
KDSLKIKEKAKATDGPDGQLDKRLKKQAKTVSVREKTGMWGYKVVTKKLSKACA